jgi:hypothetical protein
MDGGETVSSTVLYCFHLLLTTSFSAARRTFLMYAEVVVCADGEFLSSSSGDELS